MKSVSTFIFALFISATTISFSQIPNGDFENWANGVPTSWWTNNNPPSYVTITQTSDAFSGAFALQGDVVNFNGFLLGPSAISGTNAEGFAINFRPSALIGHYKFTSVNNDFLEVQANLFKNGIGIGGGASLLNPAANYTEFTINIGYISNDVPDTALIAIFVANSLVFPNIGSRIYIDRLTWGSPNDVTGNESTPAKFELMQNYPNPFNPSTTIQWALPEASNVKIVLYNSLGEELETLVDEYQQAGSFSKSITLNSEFPSGVYFYQMQTGSFIETKKMILLK